MLEVPLTRTLIVTAASILTTAGFLSRYVTDWAGPSAALQKMAFLLRVPNYPGDVMQFAGRAYNETGGCTTVAIHGTNNLGDEVIGTVTLTQ